MQEVAKGDTKTEIFAAIKKILEKSNNFPYALSIHAAILEHESEIQRAEKYFKEALHRDKSNGVFLTDYINFKFRHYGLNKGLESLDEYLAAFPESYHGLNLKGELLLTVNFVAEAGVCFDQALNLNNNYIEAALNRARVNLLTEY